MRLVLDARTAALAASIDTTASLDPLSGVAGALTRHREALASHERWALNLFVTPASRLEEVAAAATASFRRGDGSMRIGVVADMGLGPAMSLIADFHHEMAPALEVTRVEVDAGSETIEEAIEAATSLDQETSCFLRLPDPTTPETTASVRRSLMNVGRTGGISLSGTSHEALIAAVWEGSYGGVPFIAASGLDSPFTGADGGGVGIVNTMVASAAAEAGEPRDVIERVIAETDPAAFTTGASAWGWKGSLFPGSAIKRSREAGLLAIGSPDPSVLIERLATVDAIGAGT